MVLIYREIDLSNNISEREYTKKEMETVEADQAETKLKQLAEAKKATAKADLLAKLGITAEEATLLLS